MRWLVLGFAALAYANTETVSFRLPLTQSDSLGPVRLSTERGTSLEPHRLVLGNLGVTRTALHAINPAFTPVSWVRKRVQDLERQFGLEQQMVVLSWSAAVRSISFMNQYADATHSGGIRPRIGATSVQNLARSLCRRHGPVILQRPPVLESNTKVHLATCPCASSAQYDPPSHPRHSGHPPRPLPHASPHPSPLLPRKHSNPFTPIISEKRLIKLSIQLHSQKVSTRQMSKPNLDQPTPTISPNRSKST